MADTIVIASGKGGVGKSSFTVGIGKALTNHGQRVLLIDADTGLRSLDLLCGCAETLLFDWGDVILGQSELSAAVCKCESGIHLLSCPHENKDEFTAEKFTSLVSEAQADYDFILIDAPAGIGASLEFACAPAKLGIVVSTPDPVCVRSAGKAAEQMLTYGIEQTRLVINRFKRRAVEKNLLLNIDSVIDETGVQLLGLIPEDYAISYGSIYTKGQCSNGSFSRISKRLLGKAVPLSLRARE